MIVMEAKPTFSRDAPHIPDSRKVLPDLTGNTFRDLGKCQIMARSAGNTFRGRTDLPAKPRPDPGQTPA
ncbi:MAG: hypothetical protein ACTH9X_13000, partial [Corynebacterium variabile]|uniref:hypothetical protein n=1 Tax=Corynebacterium variabile TaxID=1727 RepID=UPI003F934B64